MEFLAGFRQDNVICGPISRICHPQLCHEVVFSADEAVRRCKDGEKVILVRIETSPDDIHGLHAAEGVLTTRGKGCPTETSAKDLVSLKKK